MGYMPEKSVSSGKNAPIFIAWLRKVGKKVIQACPKLSMQKRQRSQRMRKRCKSLMHGLNCVNKVGQGCYKKSTRSIRLSAQNARGQCRLCQLSRIQKSLPRLLTGQSSRNGSSQWPSVLVHLLSLLWCTYNTLYRRICGTRRHIDIAVSTAS